MITFSDPIQLCSYVKQFGFTEFEEKTSRNSFQFISIHDLNKAVINIKFHYCVFIFLTENLRLIKNTKT